MLDTPNSRSSTFAQVHQTFHPPTPLCTCISSTDRLLTTCTSHLFCCCQQAQQYYDLLPRDSPPVSPPSSDPALKKKVDNKKGNRLAAKRCREKKKQYIAFLEERCGYLEASVRYNCSLPRPHTAYRPSRSLAHRTLPSATNCSQSPGLARNGLQIRSLAFELQEIQPLLPH
jgi:hypothetical protein